MTRIYTETETIAAVTSLTSVRLTMYVETGVVQPVQTETGPAFRQIDLARLDLLCELSDQYGLEGEALDLVMSLIDQLHGVRAELRSVLAAVNEESDDVCTRIASLMTAARAGQ